MKLSIILTTILSNFATTTPNLCDLVYTAADGSPYTDRLGQTLSRYCAWAGPDAPVWDADVCCTVDSDGAACTAPDANNRCFDGTRYSCDHGEEVPGGGVVCYQPFGSMCDQGLCIQAPEERPPVAALLTACCSPGGVCIHLTSETIGDCQGTFLYCGYGMVDVDGYLECYE
ncbi:hypothetical protein ENSA5_12830 [Enhygromyxa salina]|uniref:Uncharacterized protein n=1 Tax=Enhygromyxa salina TaxID=215803 RepID=A0A2S9YF49_9BACT|nr:hypothetical protein [Enhygromyxa salina]PRQ03733.1 hypothetical protein ENSA5_12830 [Enhygromyxa salina]